jgi:RimJ/RimL family protein N-acetyltransferase
VNAVSNQHAEYPSDLDESLTLPDQRRIHIRALRHCEEAPIRELFAHLSPRTRYLRFLSPLSSLPDYIVRMLASVDYRRQLALVAEHVTANATVVVGLGSFGAVDDTSAEVSLVVRDDWQGHRVGTELALRILQAAEARGFHRFIAHIASGNAVIRKLLRNVGEVVSATASAGVSELAFVRRRMDQAPPRAGCA